MKRVLIVAMMLAMAGASLAADKSSTVFISANPDYPPLSWRVNDCDMNGAAAEIMKTVLNNIGIKNVKMIYAGPWGRVQESARIGSIDVIVGLYKTKERQQYLHFAEPPFVMDPVAIFVKKGKKFKYRDLSDLKGKTGVNILGNSQGQAFDDYANKHLAIRWTESVKTAYSMIINEQVNYMIHGLYPGLAVAELEGISKEVDHIEKPITSEGLYIGVSKKSWLARHMPEIEKEIVKLRKKRYPDLQMRRYLVIWGKTGPREGINLEPPKRACK